MTTTTARRGIAAALALITVAAGVSVAGPASATESAEPTLQRATGAEARYTGGINNLSVIPNEQSLLISADPFCNGVFKSCNAWVKFPGYSKKNVNPRGGYSVQWPDAWAPGTTQTVSITWWATDYLGYTYVGNSFIDRSVTRPERFAGLTASVSSVDHAKKTATVSGSATKGAQIRRNGSTVANSNGQWNTTVSGLQVGSNTLTFDQYVNGTYRDSRSVTVTVDPPAPTLTATGSFPADTSQRARITGVASKGATVVFRTGGVEAGRVSANATDGSYVWDVPAPDAGGTKTYTVSQIIGSAESGNVSVPLDYGTAVTIGSHEDGASAEAGAQLISGAGENGSTVTVSLNGTDLPPASVTSGAWSVEGVLLRGENTITASQRSKGANTTTSTVVVNEGESSVPAPAAEVVFDADVTKQAKIVGTAQNGATVEIRDSRNAVVGTPQVVNGAFELALTGAFGSQDYTITQTINGETSPTTPVRADFGQAVEIATTTTNGAVTVTGTSSKGAKITLTSGGREFAAFDVTNTDGTFTRDLTGLGQGNIVITATAKSKGGLSSTDTANLSLPVTAASVTFTSHPERTFTPGAQVFAGKATPGTTLTLNPFGWEPAYTASNLTTTVDQFGDWQISRGLGNTTYAMFSIKQTAQQGVTNELNKLNMRPFAEVGEPADLTVNFTAGDFFTPGQQTFTGRATPGAQVTLNPFGFTNPAYAGYDITVLADSTTGEWSIPRSLGNTTYREVAVKQDSPDASKVNLIENIFLAPTGWLGDPADLIDTTTSFTHTPGQAFTFTGTARPGTTVTLYPFGTEYPDYALTTTVKATGTWSITRQLGNQVFPVVITQDNADGKTDRIEHTMTPTTK